MLSIEQERLLAGAIENDAVYVDETLISRLEFLQACVKAERSIDFNFGAYWNTELNELQTLLEVTKRSLERFLAHKEVKRKEAEVAIALHERGRERIRSPQ